MTIFSVLFTLFTYLQISGLETTVDSIAIPSQEFCKSLLSLSSSHLVFYQAIACGTKVLDPAYGILKTVSLWHLVIVSAGHFKLILWALQKVIPRLTSLHHLVLIAFCFWTGAQPPVVRAYSELATKIASKYFGLSIPTIFSVLYSSCFVLLLFPSWASSWSFLLSWLCALLIQALENHTKLVQALGLSIGVYPVVACFASPHPLSFLFNLVLGPPLSLLLFPASLLMCIVPQVHWLTDPLLTSLLFILNQLVGTESSSPTPHYPTPLQHQLCWGYVLLLQVLLILKPRISYVLARK
jgi:hypothetical protein